VLLLVIHIHYSMQSTFTVFRQKYTEENPLQKKNTSEITDTVDFSFPL